MKNCGIKKDVPTSFLRPAKNKDSEVVKQVYFRVDANGYWVKISFLRNRVLQSDLRSLRDLEAVKYCLQGSSVVAERSALSRAPLFGKKLKKVCAMACYEATQ